MLFSSITFLYYFLPVVLAVYFLVPVKNGNVRARNIVLIAASIVFYIWGEPVYVLLLIGQTVAGWIIGLLIEKGRALGSRRMMKAALIAGIAIGVGCLGFFKYSDFFIANINALFGSSAALLGFALPIGISFYTFQILSYVIDLYGGTIKVQRNLPAFTTYVTSFPQLVAGPIVRYSQIEDQLEGRKHSLEDIRYGVRRFVIGLAKKVLLANTLAEFVQIYKASEAGGENTALYTWLYIAAYAFHIYFDFSGYSDMAIGLGRIFGFRFPENFNYPYISKSVTEFWRRWHISMSFWFRDYVYIRMGGNRVLAARHLFNILFVWLITGFWHGAAWTFVFWGLYFAFVLLFEKHIIGRFLNLNNIPIYIIRHIYVMLIVLVSWVFFDAASFTEAWFRLTIMFGGAEQAVSAEALYYLRSYIVVLIICFIGSTQIPVKAVLKILSSEKGKKILAVLEPVYILALLFVITAYLVDGSFNPFIYFRF